MIGLFQYQIFQFQRLMPRHQRWGCRSVNEQTCRTVEIKFGSLRREGMNRCTPRTTASATDDDTAANAAAAGGDVVVAAGVVPSVGDGGRGRRGEPTFWGSAALITIKPEREKREGCQHSNG